MNSHSDDQEAIMVRYLLGLSSEEERTEVEERYFSESEYFDHMLALEDSLIDDYVTGRMPPERQRAFRESFSLRGEDVRFSRALARGMTNKRIVQRTVRPKRQWPFLQAQLFTRPTNRLAFSFSIAMVVIVTCVLLVLKTTSLRRQLSQAETELGRLKEQNDEAQKELSDERLQNEASARELEAERNRRIEAESARQGIERQTDSTLKTITLSTAFIFRGAVGTTKEIRISDSVRWLRFKIPLQGFGKYDSYRVSLKIPGGEPFFESPSIKAHGSVLGVTIPLGPSKPGDYILTLEGETGGAPTELEKYAFRLAMTRSKAN